MRNVRHSLIQGRKVHGRQDEESKTACDSEIAQIGEGSAPGLESEADEEAADGEAADGEAADEEGARGGMIASFTSVETSFIG